MGLNLPTDTADVAVTVYHRCPQGASGSVQGPADNFGYWWLDGFGLRIVSEAPGHEEGQENAILAVLGWPDTFRSFQDALGELPS